MSSLVDPRVWAIAKLFVDETVTQLHCQLKAGKRHTFIVRVAGAMQHALEGECEAIEQELRQTAESESPAGS